MRLDALEQRAPDAAAPPPGRDVQKPQIQPLVPRLELDTGEAADSAIIGDPAPLPARPVGEDFVDGIGLRERLLERALHELDRARAGHEIEDRGGLEGRIDRFHAALVGHAIELADRDRHYFF